MTEAKLNHRLIHNRLEGVFALIKTAKDIPRIEREIALLAFDIMESLQRKYLSLKEGCGCFTKIAHAINQRLGKKLSEEVKDLINEGLLLDEVGKAYGPNLDRFLDLAKKILHRDETARKSKLNTFISAVRSKQKTAVKIKQLS